MPTPLPAEVRVIDLWPASFQVVLPRRDLGKGRIFCIALAIVGVVEIGLLLHLLATIFGGPNFILGRGAAAVVGLIGIPTVAGFIPLWWGLAGLIGHRELEIKGDRLRTVERVGPFWRSKRWRLIDIYGFDVVPITSSDSPRWRDVPPPPILERFNALLVRLGGGRQGMLAWGYANELLTALAETLAERANAALERSGHEGAIQSLAKTVPIAGEDDEGEDFDEEEDLDEDEAGSCEPFVQPVGSKIAIERFTGGLTIQVPPAGIWKGSSGLLFFSLIWNGFLTVFTGFAALAYFNGKIQELNGPDWIFTLVIGLFWLAGISMLLGAINMGRRQAALAVTGGHLLVIQTGLFGKKKREWAAGEIAEICAGPSGMEMNDVPILELQITDRAGKKLGILAGRGDDELSWLAWELTQSLQGAAPAGMPNPEGS